MKTYAAAQVVLALAIAATVANAATIKVNPTTGSDTAGCGSVASPCKSIGFAYNQAVAGDLIHLHPSTYSSAEDKMISTAGLSPPKWDKSGLTLETDPTVAGKAVVDLGATTCSQPLTASRPSRSRTSTSRTEGATETVPEGKFSPRPFRLRF